ncbi:molybdate-binding periplasmic protein precursor [bacterium BMS3Abin12]|nr:molybdate-binding periplasmic protein precursor [bacterium BMS3Abin12]
MRALRRRRGALLLFLLGALPGFAAAAPASVDVAVAANFIGTARTLAARFEAAGGGRVRLSFGSTGSLYAQIRYGAPFAVFLAADARRPRLLERAGLTVPGSRFTYALGRLVLWSTLAGLIERGGKVLAQGRFRHLAIANPRTAPYGAAARAVLEHLGLWRRLAPRLVTGENIAQTYQFVASGNAQLGFVALSEVPPAHTPRAGSRWLVPAALYPPIRQQAVLLARAAHKRTARAFLAYLRGPAARRVIRAHGYGLPAAVRTDARRP